MCDVARKVLRDIAEELSDVVSGEDEDDEKSVPASSFLKKYIQPRFRTSPVIRHFGIQMSGIGRFHCSVIRLQT